MAIPALLGAVHGKYLVVTDQIPCLNLATNDALPRPTATAALTHMCYESPNQYAVPSHYKKECISLQNEVSLSPISSFK